MNVMLDLITVVLMPHVQTQMDPSHVVVILVIVEMASTVQVNVIEMTK